MKVFKSCILINIKQASRDVIIYVKQQSCSYLCCHISWFSHLFCSHWVESSPYCHLQNTTRITQEHEILGKNAVNFSMII